MSFHQHLYVQPSRLQGAGMGLFTKNNIIKGVRIAEYLGHVSSWKNADRQSAYLLYLNHNHVIDAQHCFLSLAGFTNDAKGPGRLQGIRNNSYFEYEGLHAFIKASRTIAAGSEILTDYGKGYW